MLLYHVTRVAAANEIERNGFQDSEGHYMTPRLWRGVWLSDRPLLDEVDQPAVFRIDFPDEFVEVYEWVESGRNYREFLVPAELVNQCVVKRLPGRSED